MTQTGLRLNQKKSTLQPGREGKTGTGVKDGRTKKLNSQTDARRRVLLSKSNGSQALDATGSGLQDALFLLETPTLPHPIDIGQGQARTQ